MYPVLLLAAIAILAGVVVVAMGRGGELALFRRDAPMWSTRPRTPEEVATQRLPFGPVGYQVQATEEALFAAANLLAERDHEIAALRAEIWRLTGKAPPAGELRADSYGSAALAGDESPADQASSAGDDPTESGLAGSEQLWRQ